MGVKSKRFSQQLYSRILHLYPKPYRDQFGDEMQYIFSERINNIHRKQLVRFWIEMISDATQSLIVQHWKYNKGAINMKNDTGLIYQNKIFGLIAGATLLVMLIPLIAMQFTEEVKWTLSDFVVMGTLLFIIASLFIVTARRVTRYRLTLGLGFFILLTLIWAELSVGVFTSIGS